MFAHKREKPPPLAKILEYPIPVLPFAKIHMDILGPLKKDTRTGHQYILVFKDTLTRYTELVALRTRTAEGIRCFYKACPV